jgi:hypothetical protein
MCENTIKGTEGAKVNVLFQGLHMTHIIVVLVYNLNFVFCVPHLILHFKYKWIFYYKLILYHVYYAFIPFIT